MKRIKQNEANVDCVCSFCKSQRSSLNANTSVVVTTGGSCNKRETARRNSCLKIYTGDEHWSKVHQAKNTAVSVCAALIGDGSRRQSQPYGQHPQQAEDTEARTPPWSNWRHQASSRRTSGKATAASGVNIFHSLYARFRDWVGVGAGSGSAVGGVLRGSAETIRPKVVIDRTDSAPPAGDTTGTPENYPTFYFDSSYDQLLAVSAVVGKKQRQQQSNSSLSTVGDCFQSSRSTTGDRMSQQTPPYGNVTTDSCSTTTGSIGGAVFPVSVSCGCVVRQHLGDVNVSAASAASVPDETSTGRLYYGTWPTPSNRGTRFVRGHSTYRRDNFIASKSASIIHRQLEVTSSNNTESVDDRLLESLNADWSIPFNDLMIGQCVRTGSRRKVYRGRWHGDVLIYTYRQHSTEIDRQEFLKDVVKLSRIRHENVCLFMGASLEPPNLAIVTSEVKGASLYDKLHVKSETSVSLRSRVNIARQVALAVGYLHARGVVVGKLDSRNVHLEPKVKISLLDNGMSSIDTACRPCYGYLPRGKLTYIAPEMLRTMKLTYSSRLRFSTPPTTQTDVFAFGTLLYELLYEQFPFSQTPSETVIYLVCSGRRPSLTYINCSSTLKLLPSPHRLLPFRSYLHRLWNDICAALQSRQVLIEQCWSFEASERPTFTDINRELQQKTGLHKRHSSSQPDRLNRMSSSSGKQR